MQYQRPPQQWPQYQMPMPMGRGYVQYPPMTPYPTPQHYGPMRPPPRQAPSSSSLHSGHGMLSPTSSNTSLHVLSSVPAHSISPQHAPPTPPLPPAPSPSQRKPFHPPLPWQSFEGDFPPRKPRRRRRPAPQSASAPVELPTRRGSIAEAEPVVEAVPAPQASLQSDEPSAGLSSLETPSTSHPPSEILSTEPTTPSSTVAPQQTTPRATASSRTNAHTVTIVPAVPNLPIPSRAPKAASPSGASDVVKTISQPNAHHPTNAISEVNGRSVSTDLSTPENIELPPTKAPPKSWADLVRTVGQPSTIKATQVNSGPAVQADGFPPTKTASLADTLNSYSVKKSREGIKLSFLEPRGLVNTGNMCYMNSVCPASL